MQTVAGLTMSRIQVPFQTRENSERIFLPSAEASCGKVANRTNRNDEYDDMKCYVDGIPKNDNSKYQGDTIKL